MLKPNKFSQSQTKKWECFVTQFQWEEKFFWDMFNRRQQVFIPLALLAKLNPEGEILDRAFSWKLE